MSETRIAASGDLEEDRIAELVAAGAPIDLWGVGTDLGHQPRLAGRQRRLQAGRRQARGGLAGSLEALAGQGDGARPQAGVPPLRRGLDERRRDRRGRREPGGRGAAGAAMRNGEVVRRESLEQIRERSAAQLAALPERLRRAGGSEAAEPYPVSYSERLRARPALAPSGEEGLQQGGRLVGQQAAVHLGAVVEAWLAEDVEHAARRRPPSDRARRRRRGARGRARSRPRTSGTAPGSRRGPSRECASRRSCFEASRIASTSACAVGSARSSRSFPAAPSTSPWRTTTAPIGTSSCSAARSASRSASA